MVCLILTAIYMMYIAHHHGKAIQLKVYKLTKIILHLDEFNAYTPIQICTMLEITCEISHILYIHSIYMYDNNFI